MSLRVAYSASPVQLQNCRPRNLKPATPEGGRLIFGNQEKSVGTIGNQFTTVLPNA
eukprot:jgi/Botrbrau1/6671/Bobra.0202s0019.1